LETWLTFQWVSDFFDSVHDGEERAATAWEYTDIAHSTARMQAAANQE
jgi:hypothetical protein